MTGKSKLIKPGKATCLIKNEAAEKYNRIYNTALERADLYYIDVLKGLMEGYKYPNEALLFNNILAAIREAEESGESGRH